MVEGASRLSGVGAAKVKPVKARAANAAANVMDFMMKVEGVFWILR